LILRFGSSLHERLGINRAHDISQRKRQLARLVREVNTVNRSLSNDNAEHVDLLECISGRYFDLVVQATRQFCGYYDDPSGRPMFTNPSLGLKLGHNLVKCAELKKRLALRSGSIEMHADAEPFLTLLKSEWTSSVSSSALATFKHRRYNAPQLMPLTSDLVKLKSYQEEMIGSLTAELKKSVTTGIWRRLMEIVYTRVVIFNKRRCGETAKLLLEAFVNRPSGRKWQVISCAVLCSHSNKSYCKGSYTSN
jgi:hypothetical protein